MQKITPFLWFDNNAEDAVQFKAIDLLIGDPYGRTAAEVAKNMERKQNGK